MRPSELKQGIRERLGEIRAERAALDVEDAALTKALAALGGKAPAPGKRRDAAPRRPSAERLDAALAFIDEHPGRQFTPQMLRDEASIPGGTATYAARQLVADGRVTKVGETARGAPIVQSSAGTPAEAPEAPAADVAVGERAREERRRIVDLLLTHPDGLAQRQIARTLDFSEPRVTYLLKGMNGTVSVEAEKRDGNRVNIVRLKRRGSGAREAVTTPGEGTTEGRLR